MAQRHLIQSRLGEKASGYWAERALAQLRYLEELEKVHGGQAALLEQATALLEDAWRENGALTKTAVQQLETLLEPLRPLAKSLKVHCAAHAHIDMNWMWSFDETVSITVETFRTVLRLMEEYPEFRFSQSQASVYRIVELYAPELLPQIRQRVAEKRWEVTASTWVETDKNMPSGESLTRHLLYTRQYLKALLGLTDEDFRIDFEPDSFGHNANVPEILQSGGVRYYYHCRGYEGENLYRWRSPSGAEITVFREPTWYNETVTGDSFLYIPGLCARYGLREALYVYGVGDHGGGATRRDIERIRDMATWPMMPELVFGRYIDFYTATEGLELPLVEGELNVVFDGCYTSQSRIKQANRAAEAALYDAEALGVFAKQHGGLAYRGQQLADAWENVLFSHFHDILPGSCVIGTREYAMGMFQRTMATAGTRLTAAARALAASINTARLLPTITPDSESTAEGAGAGFGVPGFGYAAASTQGGEERLFVVFNTLPIPRTSCVELVVWDWPGQPARAKVLDEEGRLLPLQLSDEAQQPYWGHSYFRLLVQCALPACGYRTLLLKQDDFLAPLVHLNGPRVDRPPELVLENELVRAVFRPDSLGLVSFVNKQTGDELLTDDGCGGSFRLIDEDPGPGMTAWRVGRHMSDSAVEGGILLKDYRPDGLCPSISYETRMRASRLEVAIVLDAGSPTLRYTVTCAWRELGVPGQVTPQLAFRLPLACMPGELVYDNAFGCVHRAPRRQDVPASSYAFAPEGTGGLMLTTDSKYGFRACDGGLAVTLIRSSTDPDIVPECHDHHFALGVSAVTDTAPRALAYSALAFAHKPVAVTAAAAQTGALPPSGSFVELVQGEAVLSSVKLCEDGKGVLLRLYETSGKPHRAVLRLMQPVRDARLTDAHEQPLPHAQPALVAEDNLLHVPLRAHAVTALRLYFD